MPSGRPHMYEYVVYKGDEVICAGTRQEIQTKMNITEGTFARMASSLTKREARPNQIVVEKVSIKEIEAEAVR